WPYTAHAAFRSRTVGGVTPRTSASRGSSTPQPPPADQIESGCTLICAQPAVFRTALPLGPTPSPVAPPPRPRMSCPVYHSPRSSSQLANGTRASHPTPWLVSVVSVAGRTGIGVSSQPTCTAHPTSLIISSSPHRRRTRD